MNILKNIIYYMLNDIIDLHKEVEVIDIITYSIIIIPIFTYFTYLLIK